MSVRVSPPKDAAPFGSLEEVVRERSSVHGVKELAMQLRRNQVGGTEAIAEATAKMLRTVVSSAKYWRLEELVLMIRTVGQYLHDALPSEPVIANITTRILFLLREEANAAVSLGDATPPSTAARPSHPSVAQSLAALSMSPAAPSSPATSMHTSVDAGVMGRSFSIADLVRSGSAHSWRGNESPMMGQSIDDLAGASPLRHSMAAAHLSDSSEDDDASPAPSNAYQLKPLLIQAIQELIDEIETVDMNISKDARDHIHSGEVVLTLGDSSTVRSFLKSAAKHRKFITVVPESAPGYDGHEMARWLINAGLSVLLVPDSNVYALMPRVSKVVLGARAVLANGGILTSVGGRAIAMAAKEYCTPIVALAGVYKITPDWTWVGPDRLAGCNQGSVAKVVNYATSTRLAEEAEISNPLWDYVFPRELDVIITNVGEHPPSYVYRLIQEHYHGEDVNF